MTITVAKMTDDRIVEIVVVSDAVAFAPGTWICVCFDFEEFSRKRKYFKWIPITTRFAWVKEFVS